MRPIENAGRSPMIPISANSRIGKRFHQT